MAEYLSNLNSGKVDEKGFLRLFGALLSASGVVQSGSMLVEAQGSPDMTVLVNGAATGHDCVFVNASGDTYHGWNTADKNVTITANATGVTKKDAIVAYADLSAGSATANNPGGLKFIAVRGSGTNTAPDDTQIRAGTVGATNPYIVLAHITVSNGAGSINSGNISDQRVRTVLATGTVATATIQDSAVTPIKIAADAVTAPKIDWAATGVDAGIWWEELGRTTQSIAGGSISVSFPARKYIQILAYIIPSTSSSTTLRFNADSGNNYASRRTTDGGAEATSNTTSSISLAGANAVKKYVTVDLTGNIAADEKQAFFTLVDAAAGAGNVPERTIGAGKWVNTSDQVTSVQILVSTGNINIGSEIIVLGHN